MHVLDASRVVDVVSALIDPKRRKALDSENRELQERLRVQHAEKVRKPLLPLTQARANRAKLVYDDPPAPPFIGTRRVEPPLAELVPFIDWQFFFHAWELKGKFPAILENPAARELYDDAQALLREILAGQRPCAPPASTATGRLMQRVTTSLSARSASRSCASRQTTGTTRPNRCLADYVAPTDDFMGGFAVGSTARRSCRPATRLRTTTTRRSR